MISQAAPSAGVLVDVYTEANTGGSAVRVISANRGAATTFRVALVPQGEADHVRHYVVFDEPLAQGEALVTAPVRLSLGDVIRVRSASGDVSFTVNGLED